MNWNPDKGEHVFPNKVTAQNFVAAIKDDRRGNYRINGKPRIRKTLPRWRHDSNPFFSVFVQPFAFSDAMRLQELARNLGAYSGEPHTWRSYEEQTSFDDYRSKRDTEAALEEDREDTRRESLAKE